MGPRNVEKKKKKNKDKQTLMKDEPRLGFIVDLALLSAAAWILNGFSAV